MSPAPIDAPIDLRSQETFYADIIVTAVEGGIGYWSQVAEYRWYQASLPGEGSGEPGPAGGDNAWARIIHEDPEKEGVCERRIDLALIDAAFSRMASGPVKGLADRNRVRYLAAQILARVGDTTAAGDLDANDADNIVQIGLFGEAVFG